MNWFALEEFVRQKMCAGGVPGLALAIVQGDEILYARGFGVASVETGIPVAPETLFRIGSVSKPFTGTTIMRLVEAGKLELDRPVTEYLDWFALSNPEATRRVTLRHLLTHTSGLPSEFTPWGPRDPSALEATLRAEIPSYPLLAPPGRVYYYSNAGVDVAGCIAQRAAGKLFPQLVRESVFDPLEMKHTTYDLTVAATWPLAQGHYRTPDGATAVMHAWTENAARHPAGGIISNVVDLAHLSMLHMQRGVFRGKQVLSSDLIAEMQRPQAALLNIARAGYGLTMRTETYKGMARTGHTGWSPPFGCRWILAPAHGVAVIATLNAHSDETADAVVNRCFDDLLGLPSGPERPAAVAPDRSLWPGFEGTYVGDVPGMVRVAARDGALTADLNGRALRLSAFERRVYFADNPGGRPTSIGFVPEPAGAVQYIQVNGEPARRYAPSESVVEAAPHSALVGDYTLADIALRVGEENGRLVAGMTSGGPRAPLTPLGGTRYASAFGMAEFRLGADGRADSVLVAGRARLGREEGATAK